MEWSAWVMLVFGAVVLYGGLGICLAIAIKKSRGNKAQTE